MERVAPKDALTAVVRAAGLECEVIGDSVYSVRPAKNDADVAKTLLALALLGKPTSTSSGEGH